MIADVAVDPALLPSWCGLAEYRFFVQQFGIGASHVIAQFPTPADWRRKALEARGGLGDIELERLTALVTALSATMGCRPGSFYDERKGWLKNVKVESNRRAFDLVLAPKVDAFGSILAGTIADVLGDNRWNILQGQAVPRVAADMANAVAPLLRAAETVLLIDPYFSPSERRYQNTFRAFLTRAAEGCPPLRIEVHTEDKDTSPATWLYRQECERRLRGLLPPGRTVRFVRWKQRDGGEPLHNRYILTDVGGVSFQHGLDEGSANETDDVNLLSRPQYDTRWSQYQTPTAAFDLADPPFEIRG